MGKKFCILANVFLCSKKLIKTKMIVTCKKNGASKEILNGNISNAAFVLKNSKTCLSFRITT